MNAVAGFLTDAELSQLTGYAFKSRQVAWLEANGIPHTVNACGHPTVCWAHVIGLDEPATSVASSWTPRPLLRAVA